MGSRYIKHGLTGTPEYRIWAQAKSRCTNPANPAWRRYGGRGILMRYASVGDLVLDIGLRPSPELTLDRINNDGDYTRGNCRWATRSQQAYNRVYKLTDGDVLEIHILAKKGWTQTALAAMKGVNPSTISRTLNGKRNPIRLISRISA